MIKIDHATFTYGENNEYSVGIRDIDLEIEDGQVMLEVAEVLREVWDTGISVYVITHDLELIIECCTDVIHFENGTIADQYQMDAEGMEKIRKYFIQEKCCGKWSKSD